MTPLTLIQRIVCVADNHLTRDFPDDESMFPWHMNTLSDERHRAKYAAGAALLRDCNSYMMLKISQSEKGAEGCFHFGDITGGRKEEGLADPGISALAKAHLDDLERIFGHKPKTAFGNHDTGYRNGCVNVDSLLACEALSDLCWKQTFLGSDIVFIGICAPLLDGLNNLDALPAEVRRRALLQLQFVGDTLGTHSGQPWVLCSHSANVGALEKVVGNRVKTFRHMIYGDKHMPLFQRIYRAQGKLQNMLNKGTAFGRTALMKGFLCRSIAPYWWPGMQYGRIVLDGQRGFRFDNVAPEVGSELRRRIGQFRWSHATCCTYDVARRKLSRKDK